MTILYPASLANLVVEVGTSSLIGGNYINLFLVWNLISVTNYFPWLDFSSGWDPQVANQHFQWRRNNLHGCFRGCTWLPKWYSVPWINQLPPVYLGSIWKKIATNSWIWQSRYDTDCNDTHILNIWYEIESFIVLNSSFLPHKKSFRCTKYLVPPYSTDTVFDLINSLKPSDAYKRQ